MSATTAQATGVNPRFPLFDSLRAIAALSVFAFHLPVALRMSSTDPLWPYLLVLNSGVAVFFLISGFLLYRPFARARYASERPPGLRSYAERRVLRIVPAYWVALPIVVLLIGKSGEAANALPVFTAHGVLAYFGFLQAYDSQTLLGGISAAWTLCVEAAFYAFLPLWALLLRRFRSSSTRSFLRSELLGLTALFAIGATWSSVAAANTTLTPALLLDVTQIKPWLYVLPAFLDQFALGMGLAVLSVVLAERSHQPAAVRAIDRAPWLPILAAAIAFFLLAHVTRWFHTFAGRFIATHELQAVFAVCLLLPAVFGDVSRGVVRRVLGSRVVLWVGLVSYGLYLWHAAIISKLSRWGALDSLGSFGFIAAALGLSLLAAAVSFYAVERYGLRLSRRLSRRRRSQDADVRMGDLRRHERPEPGVP